MNTDVSIGEMMR